MLRLKRTEYALSDTVERSHTDSQLLIREGLDIHPPSTGLQKGPEALNSHFRLVSTQRMSKKKLNHTREGILEVIYYMLCIRL